MIHFSSSAVLWSGILFWGLILALYFFKRRNKERKVSALFLWKNPSKLSGGGRRLTWMERNILMLLELLAAALLLCTAAIPSCTAYMEATPIIVLLDNSASMDRDKIRKAVADDLQKTLLLHYPYRVSFVLSGNHPYLAASELTKESVILDWIKDWIPAQDVHDPLKSFALASQLCPKNGIILYYTDHTPPMGPDAVAEKPAQIDWRSLGKAEPNYAITMAARKRNYSNFSEEFLIRTANYSEAPAELNVSFFEGISPAPDAKPVLAKSVKLAPGESSNLALSYPRMSPHPFTVRISPGGALRFDDETVLLSDARPPLKTALVFQSGSPFLPIMEKTLDVFRPEVQLTSEKNADLIFSDTLTGSNDPRAWKLLFLGGDPKTANTLHGPFIAESGHPLLRDLPIQHVRWAVSKTVGKNNQGILPLVSCSDLPLISEGALPGHTKSYVMNYIPDRSNLHKTILWPLMIRNLIDYRITFLPGIETRNLHLNEAFHCYFPGYSNLLFTPVPREGQKNDLQSIRLPLTGGKGTLIQERPGLYAVSDADSKQSLGMISACLFSQDESNLLNNAPGHYPSDQAEVSNLRTPSWHDDSWIFLLAALAILFLRAAIIYYKEKRDEF